MGVSGWGGRTRTCRWRLQRPLPYQFGDAPASSQLRLAGADAAGSRPPPRGLPRRARLSGFAVVATRSQAGAGSERPRRGRAAAGSRTRRRRVGAAARHRRPRARRAARSSARSRAIGGTQPQRRGLEVVVEQLRAGAARASPSRRAEGRGAIVGAGPRPAPASPQRVVGPEDLRACASGSPGLREQRAPATGTPGAAARSRSPIPRDPGRPRVEEERARRRRAAARALRSRPGSASGRSAAERAQHGAPRRSTRRRARRRPACACSSVIATAQRDARLGEERARRAHREVAARRPARPRAPPASSQRDRRRVARASTSSVERVGEVERQRTGSRARGSRRRAARRCAGRGSPWPGASRRRRAHWPAFGASHEAHAHLVEHALRAAAPRRASRLPRVFSWSISSVSIVWRASGRFALGRRCPSRARDAGPRCTIAEAASEARTSRSRCAAGSRARARRFGSPQARLVGSSPRGRPR